MLESQGAFYYHFRFAREARTIQQFSTLDNRVQVSWLKLLLRGTPAISNCSDDLVAQFPPRLLLMAPAASRFAATGHLVCFTCSLFEHFEMDGLDGLDG